MSISSPRGRSTDRIVDGIAVAVLAGVTIIAAYTFRDYGLGWDDYTHAEYGALLLDLYASGFTDQRALTFVNLYAYGGGFDMAAALAAKLLPFDLFETRRLLGALIGVAGLFGTWRLGRRAGGPIAGLIALMLLAACPLYYGHMFMNPKDAPFAVTMVILSLGLVRALDEYPAPSAATGALCGIGLGLAIGARVLGGIAVLYWLASFLLIFAVEARSTDRWKAGARAGAFLFSFIPWLILAYAVMALAWPWSVVQPLNPIRALLYFSHFFEHPWKEMFGGALVLVPDMPRSYVPQLFALKLPELMLGLGLAGAAGAFVAAARSTFSPQRRAVFLFLALSATFPIALTVLIRPAMYNGIRHFVFVTPPIAVLGGLAGAWVIARTGTLWRPAALVPTAIVMAGLIFPIREMINLHPYQYTHFNLTAGGVPAADARYMLDYWGLAFKQAGQELRAKLTGTSAASTAHRRWRIAVCGPHRPAQVELGPEFVISWDPWGADFALTLGEFYCAELAAPILVEIQREGVIYARVYDIRGRSVSTLLTIPPP